MNWANERRNVTYDNIAYVGTGQIAYYIVVVVAMFSGPYLNGYLSYSSLFV